MEHDTIEPVAALADRRPVQTQLIVFQQVGLTLGGTQILRDVSITIGRGEFVCVVWPSGCGKTTTLRLLAGLLRPSTGSVTYDGRPVTGPRQDIAIVFQDYGRALLPWRTVAGNVSPAGGLSPRPRDQLASRETPEFLHLRGALFDFIRAAEH